MPHHPFPRLCRTIAWHATGTACIHTRNVHRATEVTQKVQTGVAVVNAGTYGSEPHMPFGGLKQSGNGTREPGTEALDVYSELKDVYVVVDPGAI